MISCRGADLFRFLIQFNMHDKELTLFDHLLNGAGWVYLHGEKVIEPIDFCRILGKLLAECIGQIMRRIG
jgi:hypothetical protein